MKRSLALAWLVAFGCSNDEDVTDDGGLDTADASVADHAGDVRPDTAIQADGSNDLDSPDDDAPGTDDASADATDEPGNDAATEDGSSLDGGTVDSGSICGVCMGGTVCCTNPKAIDYGKCYSATCLVCCL